MSKPVTKDELTRRNLALQAEVESLTAQVLSLRQQVTYMNERHEVASMMLGDAIINNRVVAERATPASAPPPASRGPVLSAAEAKELGLA